MKKIFVINGGHVFAHSKGGFNALLTETTANFFNEKEGFEVKVTDTRLAYDPEEEVKKFVWADVIIYHTPVWWFQLPFGFKKYLDEVFTAGHKNGIYVSDGRKSANPAINYGTGGLLHGTRYMLTTTWNAPATAFTLEGEFFQQRTVDEGPMFGFHRMNAFTGMQPLESMHFHDVEKNADINRDIALYRAHLDKVFSN